MEGNPYYTSLVPKDWEPELMRRMAATLIWGGDYTYEQLIEEYKLHTSSECEADMDTVENLVAMLWTALISDLGGATIQ